MHRFKKYTLALIISVIVASVPITLYAAPEETTEVAEETSEEGEGEETEDPGDGGKWIQNQNDNTWSYNIEGKNVTGWYKIGEYWYYFNGKGILLTNTKVGTYIINDDGQLTNGSDAPDFVPIAHGEIYNSSSMNTLKNGHDDAESVTEQINMLFGQYQDGKSIDNTEINKARYLYNSLPLSEKVRVNNESKLAEIENAQGIVYDYGTIYATSDDANEADSNLKKGNSYTFAIDDNHENITVITRFTTDTDMDGNGDIPSLQLISPQGDSLPITNDTPQIRNTSINASITWTDNFMQIDVASAENGNWTIASDIVCTFTSQEYIGNKKDINPIPAEENATKTNAEEENKTNEEKEEKGSYGSLIFLGVVLVMFAALIIIMKKMPSGEKTKKKKQTAADVAPVLSKEEQMEILKRELQAMDAEYNDNYGENESNVNTQSQKIPQQRIFSQDEINESIEDYSVNSDILTSNMNQHYSIPTQQNIQANQIYRQPVQPIQQPVQQTVSQSTEPAMQQTVQPVEDEINNSIQNNDYNEWYEEDE